MFQFGCFYSGGRSPFKDITSQSQIISSTVGGASKVFTRPWLLAVTSSSCAQPDKLLDDELLEVELLGEELSSDDAGYLYLAGGYRSPSSVAMIVELRLSICIISGPVGMSDTPFINIFFHHWKRVRLLNIGSSSLVIL